MIIAPLVKSLASLCISLASAPDCTGQMNALYQQYAPQSHYSYNPSYNYPAYSSSEQLPPTSESNANVDAESKRAAPKAFTRSVGAKTNPSRTGKKTSSRWLTDFDTAWAHAQKQGKPLVAIFVHHGCTECDRMDAILAQAEALQTLNQAVKARLEFTQNAAAVQRFGITLTPTFLVLSPAHNGEVYREVGSLSIERLRQLKPSIDSLVTGPILSLSTSESRQSNSQASKNGEILTDPDINDTTTRTVAAL